MMNRALACLLGAVGLLLCAGVARAQLEPVPALGLGLLLKEIAETVNEAESANDDDNETNTNDDDINSSNSDDDDKK